MSDGRSAVGSSVHGVGALSTDVGGNTVVNNTINAGSVTLADPADLNGGAVTTSAGQTYAAVNLGADTMLTSTAGSAINLGGAVTGNNFDLRVNTAGQTTFGGAVSGVGALSTDLGGNTVVSSPINAGSVSFAD